MFVVHKQRYSFFNFWSCRFCFFQFQSMRRVRLCKRNVTDICCLMQRCKTKMDVLTSFWSEFSHFWLINFFLKLFSLKCSTIVVIFSWKFIENETFDYRFLLTVWQYLIVDKQNNKLKFRTFFSRSLLLIILQIYIKKHKETLFSVIIIQLILDYFIVQL